MIARRTAAALFAAAIAATGLAATAGSADAATATVNYVTDGGFESTTVAADGSGANAGWESFDSSYQSSAICTTAVGTWCGINSVLGNGPANGAGWVWFGYTYDAHSTAYVRQSVTIPADTMVQLSYNYRNGSADAPYDATLTVKVDGKVVGRNVETRGGTYAYQTYYAVMDLTAGSHEVSFEYENGSGSTDLSGDGPYNNMTVDDVKIVPVG
jgi:hypothetical protein